MRAVLSEHLPLLVSAPEGIQKLRGLILELAVRGKLVPQDQTDEPANALLQRAFSKGKSSKQFTFNILGENACPFEVPRNWCWTSFESVFSLEYGDNLPAPKRSNSGEFPVYGSNGVVGSHSECSVTQPCIVVGRKGSAGALNLCLNEGCWVTDVAYYCIPPAELDLEFCFKLFQTLRLDVLGKGIKPGLSRREAYALPVPIPPLAEQHRIVAKVDELMALCERLEAEQSDAELAHARLVESLLSTLTQSSDAADLASNWQRIAEHFDTLFTTEGSIDALKQSILDLAVLGKLAAQEICDDAVHNTFHGIEPIQSGQSSITNLPKKWAQCTYRSLTSLVTSGSRGWKEFYSKSGALFIRTQNIKTDLLNLEDIAFVDLPNSTEGARARVLKGDILITITGANVTKAAIVLEELPEAYISQHIALTRPRWPEMSQWLHLCFIARSAARGTLESLAYGAKPGLNLNNIRDLVFPIPPLAEQRRIVAKVDELMALCDRLRKDLVESFHRKALIATELASTALEID